MAHDPGCRPLPPYPHPRTLGPGAGLALSQLGPEALCRLFFHYSVIWFTGSDGPISILSQSVASLTVTLGTSLLFSSISASSCKTKTLTLMDREFVGLKGGWGTLHSPSVRGSGHTAREPEAEAHLALSEAHPGSHALRSAPAQPGQQLRGLWAAMVRGCLLFYGAIPSGWMERWSQSV